MDSLSFTIALLVLINPFALYVYVNPIIVEVGEQVFLKHVFLQATMISLAIFAVFLLSGTAIFDHVLNIRFGAFRIFGGIVILSIALIFIVQGRGSMIVLRESLDDLASEIALPYMVGAGTISICVVAGEALRPLPGLATLALAMALNYATIALLILIKFHVLPHRLRVAFDKGMGVLLRINGFFVGAIGVDLIVEGVVQVFLTP